MSFIEFSVASIGMLGGFLEITCQWKIRIMINPINYRDKNRFYQGHRHSESQRSQTVVFNRSAPNLHCLQLSEKKRITAFVLYFTIVHP